jgi:hypothetical protein
MTQSRGIDRMTERQKQQSLYSRAHPGYLLCRLVHYISTQYDPGHDTQLDSDYPTAHRCDIRGIICEWNVSDPSDWGTSSNHDLPACTPSI